MGDSEREVEELYCSFDYASKTEQDIHRAMEEIRLKIREFESIVDKKIDKNYKNLKDGLIEKEATVEQKLEIYRTELSLRKQIIQFQEYEMRKIK